MKHAAFSRLSLAFVLLFSLWGAAHANEYDDVNTLLRQGKPAEALAKADTYIAGKPRDPQMRFLRGVILTEQNKQDEAIAAFTQLTQDFPELSEPYNNMVEQAIKLNPNYATAHENLGDVYARLAAQEYVRAQQFASTNPSVAPKLALIRQIFTPKTEAEAAALPAAPTVIRKPVGRTSK